MSMFTFEGIKCYAKIVNVYDGDTFKACIYHKDEIIKINCRTMGYDSAEMKPRLNINNRDEHIVKAKNARKHFIELTTTSNELIYLECGKFDKYGRVLVTVYKNRYYKTKSINDRMIEDGHGVSYNGGAKNPI
jgi:endonuclease YncB( thermonuclease family)